MFSTSSNITRTTTITTGTNISKNKANIALIQLNVCNNKEINYNKVLNSITSLYSNHNNNINNSNNDSNDVKFDLICLPECFSFIGENSNESIENAESFHDSEILNRYKNVAKDFNVWLSLGGFQELHITESGEKKVSNLHAIINPQGEILPENCYRKVILLLINPSLNLIKIIFIFC